MESQCFLEIEMCFFLSDLAYLETMLFETILFC